MSLKVGKFFDQQIQNIIIIRNDFIRIWRQPYEFISFWTSETDIWLPLKTIVIQTKMNYPMNDYFWINNILNISYRFELKKISTQLCYWEGRETSIVGKSVFFSIKLYNRWKIFELKTLFMYTDEISNNIN